MIFLASFVAAVCLADLAAYAYLTLRNQPRHPVIVNRPLIRRLFTFRATVLSLVMRHYMSHDANLGYRFKANTKPFRLLHRLPGNRKRFKEVNVKNFFEMRTDAHGFICNSPEQQRDYAALAQDDSVYKILVCGASVSAGYGVKSGEYSWPALLEKSLNATKAMIPAGYREVAVINASGLGSFPAQELRRFQDETIFLNPNLVLLFSVSSADYEYKGNPVDFGTHAEQKKMNHVFNYPWYARQRYIVPNLFECITARLFPPSKNEHAFAFRKEGYVNVTAAQYNLSKIRQFKGICDTHGMDFLFFLQPGMGVGNKTYTPAEQSLIKHFERYFFDKKWEEYVRTFNAYLAELRPQLTEAYQYDLIDLFNDVTDTVYCDPRHQNELGHQLLATRIEEIILSHREGGRKKTSQPTAQRNHMHSTRILN